MKPFRDIPRLGSLTEILRFAAADRIAGLGEVGARGLDLGRFGSAFGSLVLVNSPELIHEALVQRARSFEKSPTIRASLFPLLGNGLLTSDGELWRRQRRVMAPLFTRSAIARFDRAMTEPAKLVVEGWEDGAVLDISRETTRITMAVAGKALFDFDTLDESDAIGEELTTVLAWVSEALTSLPVVVQATAAVALDQAADSLPSPIRRPLKRIAQRAMAPFRLPTARTRAMEAALADLEARVARLIAERRGAAEERNDLLTLLLRARDEDGSQMDDQQIRDEVLTLFIAGHETTANALAWALMLLGQHPAWYERACAEARALAGEPRADDLPRLELLSRIFKEAMRLYPPLYLLGRVATEETELGGHLIPRGTVLAISPYALHRRPREWPDADRFDPDRFLPEREAERSKTAYLPLGAGPRVCLGASFALMEGPLILATLLQRASFELVTASTPEAGVTLRPKEGPFMRVRLRATSSSAAAQ